MLVFDNIQVHPDGEHNSYWSNLVSYDKESHKFIMELGCSRPKATERSSIKVLMSEDEIRCMSEYDAVKQAYEYACHVSTGDILVVYQGNFMEGKGHTVDEKSLDAYVTFCDVDDYMRYKGKPIVSDDKYICDPYGIELFYFISKKDYVEAKSMAALTELLTPQAIKDINNELMKRNKEN